MASMLHKLPIADADHLEVGPFDHIDSMCFDWHDIFERIDLHLRKARTATIHVVQPELLHAFLERGAEMMPLLETLVLYIKTRSAIADKDLFRKQMEELLSVTTIEVHMGGEVDLEQMKEYLDGVRPEVIYHALENRADRDFSCPLKRLII
ncbi:hypothetical protein DENSPDRAFT_835794 [Dentipellis sp. KUC8613]|nr:hypothetical protein DENSPDRAFT_835794 [Dentipellis sp. KUC8613]